MNLYQNTTRLSVLFSIAALLVVALPARAADFVPGPPENVSIELTGPRAAIVSWDAVTGANKYTLEVFTAGGTQTAILQNIADTSKALSKKTLRPNKAYYLKVKSVNDFGSDGFGGKLYFRTPPSRVQGLQVVNLTNVTAKLEWMKPRGTISGYLIQVKRKGKVRRLVRRSNDLENADPQFTLKKLRKSRRYSIRVKAIGPSNTKGAYSRSTVLLKGRKLF